MTLIEIETSFGVVAASEAALAEAVRDVLLLGWDALDAEELVEAAAS